MVTDGLQQEDTDTRNAMEVAAPVEGLKIVPVSGKGRGMIATKPFAVGDVLVSEPPYAAVASLQEIEGVCSGELVPLKDVAAASRCGGCKLVRCCPSHSLPGHTQLLTRTWP